MSWSGVQWHDTHTTFRGNRSIEFEGKIEAHTTVQIQHTETEDTSQNEGINVIRGTGWVVWWIATYISWYLRVFDWKRESAGNAEWLGLSRAPCIAIDHVVRKSCLRLITFLNGRSCVYVSSNSMLIFHYPSFLSVFSNRVQELQYSGSNPHVCQISYWIHWKVRPRIAVQITKAKYVST